MKILLLAPHPFFSHRGTPIAVKALIEVLVSLGHRITVLTYHQGEDVRISNCEIRRIPRIVGGPEIRPGFSLRKLICDAAMLWQCLWFVRRGRFDLVHAVEESAFIALVLKRLYRVPFVYDMDSSVAQQMVEKYPGLRRVEGVLEACERQAVRQSTAVLAVCQSLVDTARRHDPGKLVGKLEDVSLLDDTSAGGERLSEQIGSDGPIVMYVGNLEPYQGIDLLIEAFARALPRAPRAQLVVIGGGDAHIRHYRQFAERLAIGAQAHFIGPRPISRLRHYLEQAYVLVSPRIRGTNTAMKVYSYLDSGRPVLATRLLTHTQVLDDDIAQLVPPEPEGMAEGLVTLLTDPARCRSLVERARERVRQEFSPEAFRKKLAEFYAAVEQRVIADRRSTGRPL